MAETSGYKSLHEVPDKEVKCGGCVDSTEKVEAFCCQCADFICKECVKSHKIMKPFATHDIHSLEDLKKGQVREKHEDQVSALNKITSPDNKKKLLEKLALLKPMAAHFSGAIKDIQTIKLDTEDLLVSKLQRVFTELHQMLDERESEVFRGLRKLQDKEAGTADLGVQVRCYEALQQLCLTKVNITDLAVDPARCTVRGEGVKTAEVNKTAKLILTTTKSTYKIGSSVAVVSQLKSLYDESVIKCDVDQSGPGEYHIQYTPTVRGRHELTVSVDGQQVAGSPFSVLVSVHPTLLGKPVKVWNDISHASGLTTNTAGDVLATEYHGNIVKLEANGKTSVLVSHSDTTLSRLESIATDDEGNIYCTDLDSSTVMKCNKDGSDVQVYQVHNVKGPGHYGVFVQGNEMMLCEYFNKGTVMIYNKELQYVRRITRDGAGKFLDMSADSHGNLYAIAGDNYIHVFSAAGDFLRSFGGTDSLNAPRFLCVSGQYVYVTNYTGHNVSVFTTEGEHVTSFGHYGEGRGDLYYPCGMCTDRDGFLYVADFKNQRVQCF